MPSLSVHLAALALSLIPGCVAVPEPIDTTEGPLTDTSWILTELGGNPTLLPPTGRLLHLGFSPEGHRVIGFMGCNILSAEYTQRDARLNFVEPLVMTRQVCGDARLSLQEREYLDALRRTDGFSLTGDHLTLYEDQRVVARFAAVGVTR